METTYVQSENASEPLQHIFFGGHSMLAAQCEGSESLLLSLACSGTRAAERIS